MGTIKLDNGSELKFHDTPEWDKLATHSDRRLGVLELIASGDKCGKNLFIGQYMCEWKPDPHMGKLEDMAVDYYKRITESMGVEECRLYRKEFVQWCKDKGYSQHHINKEMQAALGRNDI